MIWQPFARLALVPAWVALHWRSSKPGDVPADTLLWDWCVLLTATARWTADGGTWLLLLGAVPMSHGLFWLSQHDGRNGRYRMGWVLLSSALVAALDLFRTDTVHPMWLYVLYGIVQSLGLNAMMYRCYLRRFNMRRTGVPRWFMWWVFALVLQIVLLGVLLGMLDRYVDPDVAPCIAALAIAAGIATCNETPPMERQESTVGLPRAPVMSGMPPLHLSSLSNATGKALGDSSASAGEPSMTGTIRLDSSAGAVDEDDEEDASQI